MVSSAIGGTAYLERLHTDGGETSSRNDFKHRPRSSSRTIENAGRERLNLFSEDQMLGRNILRIIVAIVDDSTEPWGILMNEMNQLCKVRVQDVDSKSSEENFDILNKL